MRKKINSFAKFWNLNEPLKINRPIFEATQSSFYI